MDAPTQVESGKVYQTAAIKPSMLRWIPMLLPFAWLWFHLIDNLRLQWATDPQYSYGLVVPLLVAGLLMRRWQRFSRVPMQTPELKNSGGLIVLIVSVAFFYMPTRLIEEATPEWRPIGWLLAIETIGLTLYGIYLFRGWEALKRYAFPICFFLTAVPWPSLFEQPIIQHLSRANAAMVVNIMGIIGIPAIQQGNVIQISNGLVGINDACSGIRSLHSCLMISFFFGEFYFMNWTRRLLLVPGAFILAMFFNVCRTSFLTYIAARKGIDAISQYHDEAGMTILFACTTTLWGMSYLISLLPNHSPAAKTMDNVTAIDENGGHPLRPFKLLAISLAIWVLLVETGVQLWYSIREAHIKPGPQWSIVLPESNPTFKGLPVTPEEHQLLRFDSVKQGQWQESDGTVWSAYYFEWLPGRVAGYLAKRHTPDICLPASGFTMTAGPTLTMVNIDNLKLPVRSYTFDSPDGPLQVFQCHWEPGADDETYVDESSRFNLIRGIWAGRGDKGQKVFEFVITGYDNPKAAREALVRQLEKLIKVEKS